MTYLTRLAFACVVAVFLFACTRPYACYGQNHPVTGLPFAPWQCRAANNTTFRPHLIVVHEVRQEFRSTLDPDGDGYVNGTFYHDRYGVPRVPQSDCASGPSRDCAPYAYENISVLGGYECNDGAQCGSLFKDYDVIINNRSVGKVIPDVPW